MKKNNYPGKFIVFEGLDGSGQSTEVSLLKDYLITKGHSVVSTKEPTQDTEPGKKIKQVLSEKEKIEPEVLQELFSQDRKEHLEKLIIPALEKGQIVISDRYFFSSFAYGQSESLSLDDLIKLNNDFLLPDKTIILKVKPEICIQRIEKRGTDKTLFEKVEKLKRVWENYAVFPSRFENVIIVDGEGTIEQVFEQVKKVIDETIP